MLTAMAPSPAGLDRSTSARTRRTAAAGGLTFVVLYLAHRLLQLPGPADASPVAVAADVLEHRDRLLASEMCNGLGLLAFVIFLAALLTLLRCSDAHALHHAVLAAGTAFIALGYASTATETALVHIAATGDLTAIRVLFELQARIPVVFVAAAFTAATALAADKARLLPRAVAAAGLALAALFAAGAVFSLTGAATSDTSPIGPLLFLVWTLTLSIGAHRYNPTLA
jgi:hypothetical protein